VSEVRVQLDEDRWHKREVKDERGFCAEMVEYGLKRDWFYENFENKEGAEKGRESTNGGKYALGCC